MPANSDNSHVEDQPRRANLLLAIGAIIGIAMAASGIIEPAESSLQADAVAQVGERQIDREQFLAYLNSLSREKRNPLTDADQRHVLARMIDEQLLLARGIELGLPWSSGPVKTLIVQEVMQAALTDVRSEDISERQLAQFYRDNHAYFAKPARTQLRRLVFRDRDGLPAAELALRASQALQQGADFNAVRDRYATQDLLPLPAEPLPNHKLLQYLGRSVTDAVATMPAGAVSKPIQSGADLVVVQILYKQAQEVPPFDQVRDRVVAEYSRRRGDQAIADYLQDLRRQTDIVIDEQFLDAIAPARAGE
jgi:parvulin-like peptidyl-prolyl isomerase